MNSNGRHLRGDPLAVASSRSKRVALLRSSLVLALQSLSPVEFEQICYLLVEAEERLSSVHYLGAKGSDDERDIVAVDTGPDGTTRNLVFQCKRLAHNRSDVMCRTIERIKENETPFDCVVFMTSQDVSARIADTVLGAARKAGMAVLFWGSTRITALLYKHRRIMEQFFEIPYADEVRLIREAVVRLESNLDALSTMLSVSQLSIEAALQRPDKPTRARTSFEVIILLVLLRLVEEAIEVLMWGKVRSVFLAGPSSGGYPAAGSRYPPAGSR